MNNQNKKLQFRVEIEIWQGLVVASILFLLVSGVLFFGAVIPQNNISDILNYNDIKTQVYADYSSTKSFEIDTIIATGLEPVSCENTVFFEASTEKNASYIGLIDDNEKYITDQNIDSDSDFAQFISASELYNGKLKSFLELQSETSLTVAVLLNEFQNYCTFTGDAILEHIQGVNKYTELLKTHKVTVNPEWQDNLTSFGQLIAANTESQTSETLKQLLAKSPEIEQTYTNLFDITINFNTYLEEINAVDGLFLSALRTYELSEFTSAGDAKLLGNEILYFSDAVQKPL